MANFLLIDTSSKVATVAVSKDGAILACERFSEQNQQAAAINLMIEKVLQQSGLKTEAIDCYCVCAGPGSYTGLRVGMSTAKGMAFALGKPMISFDRLQLLALSMQSQNVARKNIGVLLQARKAEYFWALFDAEGNEKIAPKHIFEADLEREVPKDCFLMSDAPQGSFSDVAVQLTDEYTPDILEWIKLAQGKWNNKEFADIAYAEPFYLKAAFTTHPKNKL
jgi:tRNA threonylcarbamoyladenosine biosynthesis protein TsaB